MEPGWFRWVFLVAAVVALSSQAWGQGAPLLRPPDSAVLEADGARIVIDYSRPSMRGRKIMGNLVPWNTVWRTGANRATHLTTSIDLMFGDVRLPAGRYTLYTVPNPSQWTLIINRETDQWGTVYHYDQDLARIPATPRSLPAPVELFSIALEPAAGGGAIVLTWETTRVTVPFQVAR